MVDKSSIIRSCSWLFIVILLSYMVFNYFVFSYLLLWDRWGIRSLKGQIFMGIYQFSFVMMAWSYLATSFTDPGRIPQYLGFFLDNPDQQRKRYCLHCHTYKPERCHHCSFCNRCVLNMDHHCPWVQNCIGFYNKKFFILLLFYVLINFSVALIGYLFEGVLMGIRLSENGIKAFDYKDAILILAAVSIGVMLFVFTFFFKFHILMVMKNMTTLENLDRKRGKNPADYDFGTYNNWVQVFGKEPCFWIFPFFTEGSKPVGEGITWPRKAVFNDPNSGLELQVSDIGKAGPNTQPSLHVKDLASPMNHQMVPNGRGQQMMYGAGFPSHPQMY